MIKLDSNMLGRLGAHSFVKKSNSGELNSRSDKSDLQQVGGFHFSRNDAKGFALFHRSVTHRIQLALPGSEPMSHKGVVNKDLAEQEMTERDERAELASSNILGFIQSRIKSDMAEGASEEQLASRLDAALAGFNEGYQEASGILKDLNLMSPSVEQDIQLTREKVLAGLDELRRDVLGGDPGNLEVTMPEKEASSTQIAAPSASDALKHSSLNMAQGSEFEFELTTRDGDTVIIRAAEYAEYQERNLSQGNAHVEASSSFNESQFHLSIEGELDHRELEAINDLLSKVKELSTDFYAGDLGLAYKKALELGYDNSKISEFAVSLSQTRQIELIQTYQPEQAILKPNVVTELRPLGRFASALSQSLTMANEAFSHPRELLGDLFKQMDLSLQSQESTTQKPLQPLAERLLDRLVQLQEQ